MARIGYIGRFAPSPTGPLHQGSLIAAVASFLDAKFHTGEWRLRIEDLDPPREVAGTADSIIQSLVSHGLHWDGEICWQSERSGAYQKALALLDQSDLTYACNCSRALLAKTGGVYPGNCRRRHRKHEAGCAIRLRVCAEVMAFDDLLQGPQQHQMDRAVGDFIVQRRDGLFAYQLAVVADDAHQGVTHVVRGADILASTTRQIYLQRLLQLPTPRYAHIPILANHQGQKLSKQNLAPAIDDQQPVQNLLAALRFLGQTIPDKRFAHPHELLAWAARHWCIEAIPKTHCIIDPLR